MYWLSSEKLNITLVARTCDLYREKWFLTLEKLSLLRSVNNVLLDGEDTGLSVEEVSKQPYSIDLYLKGVLSDHKELIDGENYSFFAERSFVPSQV